jgi:hypothetical protein
LACQGTNENGKEYIIIDGKQRLSELHRFLNDKFALADLEELKNVELDSGGTFNIAGKLFSELPQEVQEEIKGFSVKFLVFEIP